MVAQDLAHAQRHEVAAQQHGVAEREVLGDRRIVLVERIEPAAVDAVLLSADPEEARRVRAKFAVAEGPIVPVIVADAAGRYDW